MATTTIKCPICGSENVTPSHLRGFEKLLGIVFPRSPYRCKECWSRFWLGSIKGPMFRIVLGLAVLLLAIFFVLPIRQLWHKEDSSPKTISKPIEIPDKTEPSVPAKPDVVADADEDEDEDEEGPEAPQLPQLKEPNVEVPKGDKPPVSKPVAQLPAAKAETKPEKKLEIKEKIDDAENTEEKVVGIPKGAVRKLKSITANTSDNTVEIVVSADGPVRDYKNFFLLKESPPKLVVDIKGKWKYSGKYAMDVNSDLVSKIRVAEHNEKGFFRIVMDLKVREGMTPVFNEDAKGLVIIVKK